ncbi:2,3-dehydroadipyl-CoA hydratase PaaF [Pseudomaricurvus alcaniphilus]|uniref:2,3-dehydroadipyl-CoA hydratase PaaF n=1 Tax=Pseudomaricurvus alcaniphilus TaxID=1166482 RepID=UPI001FB66CB6|nr:2,3-dehydroadipyl-CoA hydratase PaaF [Pseudomaricurvus alcaniphilus]
MTKSILHLAITSLLIITFESWCKLTAKIMIHTLSIYVEMCICLKYYAYPSGDYAEAKMNNLKYLLLDHPASGVALITINRPKVLNALSTAVLEELVSVLEDFGARKDVRAVVITGGAEVFAAGADLKAMSEADMLGILYEPRPQLWQRISDFRKPLIAAVNGYALGAGCELVMHADIVVAGETAKFGQPEINMGIIPGAGGTQRLIRAVGKSLAMKMVLAGEFISAAEALAAGLVSDVTLPEASIERALEIAGKIAAKPPIAVEQAKDVLLNAFETSLEAGLKYERKAFVMLAGTEDRNEGINAFLEKRKPNFKGA